MFMGEETQGVDHFTFKGYLLSIHVLMKAVRIIIHMTLNTMTVIYISL